MEVCPQRRRLNKRGECDGEGEQRRRRDVKGQVY